jgi:phosphatidylserine decarboxylase
MRLPLTRYAPREIALYGGLPLALGGLAAAWGFPLVALPFLALGLFSLSFFRDPERAIPAETGAVVSPADGTVTDVTEVEEPEFIGGPATRIGIFLSVFNVHVNRAPVAGAVELVRHVPGEFRDARRAEEASRVNEANLLGLRADDAAGTRVLVRQIAGAIARRIVCVTRPGERLARGQRYGMIKFGSRTELFLPRAAGFQPAVRVGDRVRGGATVVGRLAPAREMAERPA